MNQAQAQLTKGSFIATGSAGYHVSNRKGADDNSKNRTQMYLLSPQVGFLISNNLELGLLTTLSISERHGRKQLSADIITYRDQEIKEKALGAYLRRYFFLIERLALTGRGEISYSTYQMKTNSYSKQKGTNYDFSGSSLKRSDFEVAVRPGLSYFLSDKINLNTTFGEISYNAFSYNSNPNQDGEYKEDTKKLTMDISSTSFSLGLSYFF